MRTELDPQSSVLVPQTSVLSYQESYVLPSMAVTVLAERTS